MNICHARRLVNRAFDQTYAPLGSRPETIDRIGQSSQVFEQRMLKLVTKRGQSLPLCVEYHRNGIINGGFARCRQMNANGAPITRFRKSRNVSQRLEFIESAVETRATQQERPCELFRRQAIGRSCAAQGRQDVKSPSYQAKSSEPVVYERCGLKMNIADKSVDSDGTRVNVGSLPLPLFEDGIHLRTCGALSSGPGVNSFLRRLLGGRSSHLVFRGSGCGHVRITCGPTDCPIYFLRHERIARSAPKGCTH